MEMVTVVLGDGNPADGGNYQIEVADGGITVYGCDCADHLTDPVRIARLRNALDQWLKDNALKGIGNGQ